MDKIQKIRQEIERLKKLLEESTYYLENSQQALGYSFALDDFDEFLNAHSEEPDKSLKEAAEEYARLDNEGVWKDGGKYKGFIAGAEWQKEQMLKEAVEGLICATITGTDAISFLSPLPKELTAGDKVRIIIVKEEKQ